MPREYPTLPGEFNKLIFAAQDGELKEIAERVSREYESLPRWRVLRRHRLEHKLFLLTLCLSVYRAGAECGSAFYESQLRK